MQIRPVITVLFVLLLSGCPTKKSPLMNRDIQLIEVGSVSGKYQFLEKNESIQEVSESTTKLVMESGFELLRRDYSFGIAPLTGRTKNLVFRHRDNEYLYCHVTVSKYQYQVVFREVELGHKTGVYSTTRAQKEEISELTLKVKNFIEVEYPGADMKLQIL